MYSFLQKYSVTNLLLKYIWNRKIISWQVRFYKKSITSKMNFLIFWKKYVPSDEIKLRDEINGFDGTMIWTLEKQSFSGPTSSLG